MRTQPNCRFDSYPLPLERRSQGHLKTVIILTGGCLLFGDTMPPKKLLGIGIAMAGIVW